MKKCPKCGAELHEDSIFCFGCMSELNDRHEITLNVKIPSSRRNAVFISVIAGVTAACALMLSPNRNGRDIPVDTENGISAVSVSGVVSEAFPPTTAGFVTTPTTTAAATTTTTTTTTETTTTTTSETLAETGYYEEPEAYRQEPVTEIETTPEPEPEPEYFSPDGATDATLAYLEYINPIRETYGAPPLHACGQLDKTIELGFKSFKSGSDPYKNLETVGLPSDTEILKVDECPFNAVNGDIVQGFMNRVKGNGGSGYKFAEIDLAHSMRDYTYLSVTIFYDEKYGDEFGYYYIYYIYLMK